MAQRMNPFHDLYLAERIDEDRFVKLFSPIFVKHALPLFQPGNVILKGLQGSGKTMLLNLLKPKIRLAYHCAGEEFPVPKEHGRFIGAGINLRKAGPIHFGQLLHQGSSHQDVLELVLFFADFVNYLIVDDMLQTIDLFYSTNDLNLLQQIGLSEVVQDLDGFAIKLARDQCWFGALDDVCDYKNLREKLRTRIVIYREYINLNRDEVPSSVKTTKTAIGDPVLATSGLLRECGILSHDAQVLVRIDQYEQLPTFNVLGFDFGDKCQQIIHKALAARDSRVSYRIGTRQYAWPERPVIIGTIDILEHKRDFSIIDIDETLRRKENPRTWIFPSFAEDIFERRLTLAEIARQGERKLLQKIFGVGLTPTEHAEKLVGESSRGAIIQADDTWPEAWVQFLIDLAIKDPLSAKLGEGWCQQVKGVGKKDVMYDIPTVEPYPWIKKRYWMKERIEQALIQIASRNRQQLIWGGCDDLLGLSGGNILVFLFLCQHIWDAWLRDNKSDKDDIQAVLPEIDNDVQTTGIIEASEEWLRKQLEGADVKRRQEFVNRIGKYFYKILTEDKSMSHPGRNGFSIRLDDLEADHCVDSFLKTAVDYGDLYDAAHTSKTKGEKRRKYYLAPILSPAFKVPYTHTKEPEYLSGTTRIREWMGIETNLQKGRIAKDKNNGIAVSHPIQGSLFTQGKKKIC